MDRHIKYCAKCTDPPRSLLVKPKSRVNVCCDDPSGVGGIDFALYDIKSVAHVN